MDFTLSVTGSEFSPATGERTFIVMVKEKEGSVGSRLQEGFSWSLVRFRRTSTCVYSVLLSVPLRLDLSGNKIYRHLVKSMITPRTGKRES